MAFITSCFQWSSMSDPGLEQRMEHVLDLVSGIRRLKKEYELGSLVTPEVEVRLLDESVSKWDLVPMENIIKVILYTQKFFCI